MYAIMPDMLRYNPIGMPGVIYMKDVHTRLKTTVFNPELLALNSAAESMIEIGARLQKLEKPIPQIFDHMQRNYLPGTATALERVRRKDVSEDKRIREVRENGIKALTPITDIQALMLQQQLRGLKQSEIIKLALSDRRIGAFAIADETNFKLLGFSEAARPELLRELWKANTVRSFEGSSAKSATLTDILGRNPRTNEAIELADIAERELDRAQSDVDDVSAHISSAIKFTASVADVRADAVWSMMQKAA